MCWRGRVCKIESEAEVQFRGGGEAERTDGRPVRRQGGGCTFA